MLQIRTMNTHNSTSENAKPRISRQQAAEIFSIAAQLQAKKQQDYSHAELIQAGTEAGISSDVIQEALQQMQKNEQQTQAQRQKLRLQLGSGLAGAAIVLLGILGYSALKGTPAFGGANQPNVQVASNLTNSPAAPVPDNTASTFTGTGVVQQYLLNPEGRVDGLLLNTGVQVKFPPQAGDALKLAAPQTSIEVVGNAGTPSRFGQEVKATQIRNPQTGQTLALQPADPAAPPTAPNYSNVSADSTLQRWLVGRRGEVNGAILASGLQVKFGPHVGAQLASTAQIGAKVQVQGFGTRNDYGQIIQATALTVNGQSVAIAPPKLPPAL